MQVLDRATGAELRTLEGFQRPSGLCALWQPHWGAFFFFFFWGGGGGVGSRFSKGATPPPKKRVPLAIEMVTWLLTKAFDGGLLVADRGADVVWLVDTEGSRKAT